MSTAKSAPSVPPMTPEQTARLVALLRPYRQQMADAQAKAAAQRANEKAS